MKKLFAVIICIVLLASCLSFPSTAKGDGSDFILSPSYWFYPGNIYNSLYDDETVDSNTSRETPSHPAPSPTELVILACLSGIALVACTVYFCFEKSDEIEGR